MASQQMKILLEVQDKATRALKNSQKAFKKLGNIAKKAGKGMAGAMGRVVKSILSLKTALIGVAGVAGFGLLIKSSLKSIDSLGKVSSKLGIASDDLQRFRLASELAGIETTALDMGLQRFTRRAGEAVNGTGEAKDALAKMGIQLTGMDGKIRSTRELLGDVAHAFTKVKDPAERLRLAFKLFDSEGVAMVNILNKGRDGLEQMLGKADELGIILDEKTVKSAERVNDQFLLMGKTFVGLRDRLTGALAPALEKFSGWWTEFMKSFNTAIAPLFDWMIAKIGQLGADFGKAEEAGKEWGLTIGYYVQELVKGLVDFFKKNKDGISKFDEFKQKAVEMYHVVKPILEDLATAIGGIARAIALVINGIKSAIQSYRTLGGMVADAVGAGTGGSERISGSRASGGGVSAGSSYLVGERGAEVFTPTTSGTVSASASGMSYVTNIYTSASAHGIDSALASKGDSISRGSRVGLSVGSLGGGGYMNLSTKRVRS